jgi:hypothetical protein
MTSKVKNSQLSSEQTNLDVTSGKTFTSSRRGYKCLVSVNATNGGNSRRRTVEAGNETNFIEGNVREEVTTAQAVNASNVNSGDEAKPFLPRRHSGLPLVNRKITDQETIMLETYRAKGLNAPSNGDFTLAEMNQNINIGSPTKIERSNQRACETNNENRDNTAETMYVQL